MSRSAHGGLLPLSYDAAISVQTASPTQGQTPEVLARATVEIPRTWLMSSLLRADVGRVQRVDTQVDFGADCLRLIGIELVVQRCWFREGHWLDARRTIIEGYVHSKTWVELIVRGDRRRTAEMVTAGAHPSGRLTW